MNKEFVLSIYKLCDTIVGEIYFCYTYIQLQERRKRDIRTCGFTDFWSEVQPIVPVEIILYSVFLCRKNVPYVFNSAISWELWLDVSHWPTKCRKNAFLLNVFLELVTLLPSNRLFNETRQIGHVECNWSQTSMQPEWKLWPHVGMILSTSLSS